MEKRQLIEATCPDCRGPLTEVRDGEIIEFHCLVGHRYSPLALLQSHYEAEERALWAAVVALEEVTKIVAAVTPHLNSERIENLERSARDKREQANQVRKVLEELRPYVLEA